MADINGTSGNDVLEGTEDDDNINGLSGDDVLNGLGGNDVLDGFTGNDTLNGGEGNDTLSSLTGNNQLSGDAGNDTLNGGSGNDNLDGGTGNDVLDGSSGEDLLFGGSGDDELDGSLGDDILVGEDGDDILEGGLGADLLVGGAGADQIDGGIGFNDIDIVSYDTSDAAVTINLETGVYSGGHAEGDIVTNIEFVITSNFNDTVIGSSDDDIISGLDGNDTLSGGAGDDVFVGGAGADIIDGGAGFDTVSFQGSVSGVTASLITGTGTGGDAEGDSFTNIIDFIGSDFNDNLTGDGQQNFLLGLEGDDVLTGGSERDGLEGGAGNDLLIGDGSPALSLDSVEGEVYRAFQAVFDRAPDLGGFNAFVTEVRAGRLTQEAVIAEFVESPEFQQTFGTLDNQGFVEQLFRNVLDREGDDQGIINFTNALEAETLTRAEVVLEFANSPEFVQLMTLPSASFATNVIIHPAEGQVFRIFQAVFNREPDFGGFTNFVNSIQAGVLTAQQITAEFVASPEFQATFGDLDDTEFVELLFTNVLPGNMDQQGRADFIEALGNGTLTRAQMVAELADSQELRNSTAEAADAFVATIFETSEDELDGGTGNDILLGGRGADDFIFDTLDGGADIILDFTAGVDEIDLGNNNPAFNSLAEILAAGSQVGLDTVFDFGGGNTLTLNNTVFADLEATDFFGFGGGTNAKVSGFTADASFEAARDQDDSLLSAEILQVVDDMVL